MALYVMRHGLTDMNMERRMQGRSDIELNEKGRAQASLVGEIFKLKGVEFSAVYSSPLKRARKTAQLASGFDEHDIILVPDLIEMGFGEYELSVIPDLPPEVHASIFDRPGELQVPEGVETHASVVERAKNALSLLRRDWGRQILEERKDVLVVTHGGLLLSMLLNIQKKPVSEFWNNTRMHNCGVFTLELNPDDIDGGSDKAHRFFMGF